MYNETKPPTVFQGQGCVSPTPDRQPEIACELNRLTIAVEDLQGDLLRLYEKLKPVLREMLKQDTQESVKEAPPVTPVGGVLRRNVNTIQACSRLANAISMAVEL